MDAKSIQLDAITLPRCLNWAAFGRLFRATAALYRSDTGVAPSRRRAAGQVAAGAVGAADGHQWPQGAKATKDLRLEKRRTRRRESIHIA